MKTLLIGFIGLVVLGGAAFLVLQMFSPSEAPQDTTNTDPFGQASYTQTQNPGQPIGQVGSGGTGSPQPVQHKTVAITGEDATKITIRDFSDDPDLFADPANPGIFMLGYHPFDTSDSPGNLQAPYYIQFIQATQMFVIGLNQEPLPQTRVQMEQYLMSKLGINKDKMCKLRYSLSVPNYVNSYYAGVSLGFSFCPGAVQLAQ